MNTYENLKQYHADHIYKRGHFKGDAPVGKRNAAENRIVLHPNGIAVRRYSTDIIVVAPDNTFTLRANGWHTSPTTRKVFQLGFAHMKLPGYLYSSRARNLSTTQVRFSAHDESYEFYDGMTFDANGKLTSPNLTPRAKRINSAQSKAFHAALKTSGFKAVFPILFASLPDAVAWRGIPALPRIPISQIVTDATFADSWGSLVQRYCWMRSPLLPLTKPSAAEQCWAAIMRDCKHDMYEIVTVGTDA